MLNPKYSIGVYYDELVEEDIEKVYSYLSRGIVVHLFLRGILKEELELNEYDLNTFKLPKDNNLLFVYEEETSLYSENIIIFVDNKILNKEAYKNITENRECEFNKDQYEIITAPVDDNIIVTSGAGTGKTTTMINRLIYLRSVMSDFTFDQAALITFTNKASIEMKERLLEVLDKYFRVTNDIKYLDYMEEAAKSSISTIHKFAKKILNKSGRHIGINKDINVRSFKYNRQEAVNNALNKIYKEESELFSLIKYYPIYEVERVILKMWEILDNYSIDLLSNKVRVDFNFEEDKFTELISKTLKYAQEILDCDKENELEISDLMKKLAYEDIFKGIDTTYKVIMIDEFQDSDNTQIEFISELEKKTGARILVVGDEKQSIYRFRGAEYTAFDKLKKLLSNSKREVKEYEMTRNYRTNYNILNEINRIFIEVDKKLECFNYKEKDYIYSNKDKDNPKEITCLNVSDNLKRKEFFDDLLENKKEDESIAVLFRSNSDIKEFKEFCDRNNILCMVDSTGGFYRHEAVRDFYIMIKSIIDEKNSRTMYSFINTPYIFGDIDKNIILNGNSKDKNEFLYYILEKNNWNYFRESSNFKNSIILIDEIIEKLKPVKNYYVKVLLEAKKNQHNYVNIAKMKALEYKLNLEHLVFILKKEFSENITSIEQIEQFLKVKISTDNLVDVRKPKDYENDYIQCSTVHKAKGLEYDYVVLDKLTNHFLSNSRKVNLILKPDGDKLLIGYKIRLGEDEFKNKIYSDNLKYEKKEIKGEEARLLYVALTRCKKGLYLNMSGELAATESLNTWKSLIGGTINYV